MATDYGGGYGGQPWGDAEPPYAGPPYGVPAGPEPPDERDWQRRSRVTSFVAWAALVVGGLGFLGSLAGVIIQVSPRQFSAAQARQITNWEWAIRWRTLPAGKIFPATVRYTPPAVLNDDHSLALTGHRIGIAGQAPCKATADAAAAAILIRKHCLAMLRATYADGTDSYVVTVGVAVLPGATAAVIAQRELASGGSAGNGTPTVRTARFKDTPAAAFTNSRREVSGAIAAGTYLVLYTIGYADSRPRQPVTADSYGYAEMTSFGEGVARAVLAVLGAPVPQPRCPGAPGC